MLVKPLFRFAFFDKEVGKPHSPKIITWGNLSFVDPFPGEAYGFRFSAWHCRCSFKFIAIDDIKKDMPFDCLIVGELDRESIFNVFKRIASLKGSVYVAATTHAPAVIRFAADEIVGPEHHDFHVLVSHLSRLNKGAKTGENQKANNPVA